MGNGLRLTVTGGASALLLLALTAADRPSVLSQASGGLWELSGGPGRQGRSRQCIRDTALLAQLEHRRSSCERAVLRDDPTSALIHYSCAGGGFGQTSIAMITPRSFRIETQGISAGAPFHYVLQARRIGNCPVH